MDEKEVQVEDTTEETQPETTEQAQDDVKEEVAEEPVDDKGVPLKNRIAEAKRKLIKQEKEPEKGNDLEVLKTAEEIAVQSSKKAIEPILVKQFLYENPQAAELVEEINAVRAQIPELSGVEHLETVFKIVKAEKQDELLRQAEENGRKETEEKLNKAGQSAIEGAGKTPTPASNLADRIKNATSLKELQELEALIQ
jgi:hypothetical protein